MENDKPLFFITTFNEQFNQDNFKINDKSYNCFYLNEMESIKKLKKKSTFKYLIEKKFQSQTRIWK